MEIGAVGSNPAHALELGILLAYHLQRKAF